MTCRMKDEEGVSINVLLLLCFSGSTVLMIGGF